MTDALYSSFARIFYSLRDSEGDTSAILDQSSGFAPRLRDACQKALDMLQSDRVLRHSEDEELALRLERDTWDLLQDLYGARKTTLSNRISPVQLVRDNPYVTPQTLVNHIINASPTLMELVITREWLQNNAPNPQAIELSSAYRNFTRLQVLHQQRLGGTGTDTKLVKELDPDATMRNSGSTLTADDAAYEKALAHVLYTYLRAGQSEQAMELCRSAQRPWLAAAMQGYSLFDWQAMTKQAEEDDAMEQDSAVEVTGNKRRRLWKKTCIAAALDTDMPISGRVLNAALAPSRKTLGILVKEACKTWEDHLWARVATLFEEKMSEATTMLGPNFWERDSLDVEPPKSTMDIAEFERAALEEAREVLGKMVDLNVEGPGPEDPFHLTQLRVILDQADPLLQDFAHYLGGDNLNRNTAHYARLTRFFAHLCLFFDFIGVPISPLVSQRILEAYVTVLEEQGHTELIAQYAAALGENAVSRYALFLSEIPVSSSLRERREALFRAAEFGLDVGQVALSAADLCLERAFKALSVPSTPYPSISSDPCKLSDPELALINAVDWLGFQESTYQAAVVRFNSVLRYFLCTGNLYACQELRERRPQTLRDEPPGNPSDRYEYLHYERFFVAWAALGLAEHLASQLNRPGRIQHKDREVEKYESTLRKAREQIIDLLTNNWLQSGEIESPDTARQSELERIREMYVPELLIRLQRTLFESRSLVPRNIKASLTLANIVADSRFEIYEAFNNPYGNRLREFLDGLRKTVLAGLDSGGSDPFRPVS
ncbi:hypothetical protein M422DRAFT_223628 [Sphaerobolus stellatus SS14]|nr:hypothetical protein M422DRAFT_223628 [Sphaerobolus stellatus SS14]